MTFQKGVLVVIEKIVILDWNIGFINAIISREFQTKYFKDNEVLYKKNSFLISKYCPISK